MPWKFEFGAISSLDRARTNGATAAYVADESAEGEQRFVLWLIRDGCIRAEQIAQREDGYWGYLPIEHHWSASCPLEFLDYAAEPADPNWRDRVRRYHAAGKAKDASAALGIRFSIYQEGQ